MMKKIKIDPLCRGARRIALLTLPLILFEIAYIIIFIKDLSGAEILANREVLHLMLEDTFASAVTSLGGVLFYDYYFKRETENE